MNVIASFFLRAKHWQIFLLLFGLMFVGQIAIFSAIATAVQSPEQFPQIGAFFGSVYVLFMVCFLGWFWSMGTFLSSIVQPSLKVNIGFFRFSLVYPALYLPALMTVFQRLTVNPALFAVIFPLHVIATFCTFYLLYFASKNLVLAETSKPTSFYDYVGPFCLMWFFPIGVWIIQPRINRLYAERRCVELFNVVNPS